MGTYYFDPTATGSSGAGTIVNPYTNMSQLSSLPSGASNTLLFKRGTTWRIGDVNSNGNWDFWQIPGHFLTNNDNIIDAYGTGAIPIIDGSIDLTSWTNMGGGVYRASMAYNPPSAGYVHHNPGNLSIGTVIPTTMRWRGSYASTFAATSASLACSYDWANGYWYLKSPTAPGTVQASYWRVFQNNEQIGSTQRTGCAIKNIKLQRFSAYPINLTGLNGVVVDGVEGWCIGGMYRDTYSFWEGNFIGLFGGCDNAVIQNCTISDVFDAGISPQFGFNWSTWNSLSNVLIKNNSFYRCGLAGVEITLQSQDGCTISGVLCESNYFEECGQGPFADTTNGFHAGIDCGQQGNGGTSISTQIHIKYNTFKNCSAWGGDMKAPSSVYIYGNKITKDAGYTLHGTTGGAAITGHWSVNGAAVGGQYHIQVSGNVIDGFTNAIAVDGSNNFPLRFTASHNTLLNGSNAFYGNWQTNVTFDVSNTTVHNFSAGASSMSGTFTSNGGMRLSSVGTTGFTLNGTDQTGQSAPTFVSGTYMPTSGSALFSGGNVSYTLWGDPLQALFSTYPASRNAYAVYNSSVGGSAPTTYKINMQFPAQAYGKSGVTAYVWVDSLSTTLPFVVSGVTISGSGVLAIDAPPGAAVGQSVNVLCVTSTEGSGLFTETVDAS